MRYIYSLIRFVPDPVRAEFVNMGAIVGSEETSEWGYRLIGNPKRARCIDEEGVLNALYEFVNEIGGIFDDYEESLNALVGPTEELSEEWLETLHLNMRNVVQLSDPLPVSAETLDDALDVVMDRFAVDPERQRRSIQTKHSLLGALRTAYRRRGLKVGKNIQQRVYVQSPQYREQFDFAVFNGRAVQLANAWSFQIRGQENLADSIKAWGWVVQEIREKGGSIRGTTDGSIVVPSDVDIQMVYVEPQGEAPVWAFREALAVCKKLEIQTVPGREAERVASRARELVGDEGL